MIKWIRTSMLSIHHSHSFSLSLKDGEGLTIKAHNLFCMQMDLESFSAGIQAMMHEAQPQNLKP